MIQRTLPPRLSDPDFLFSLLVLLIASGACGRTDTSQAGHSFRVETGEDGVRTAITSGVPKYGVPPIRFVDELRLRSDEERPESLLYQASEFERGPDGNYYVLDSGNHRVAVFGPDGTYLRAFGREGEGPGEFGFPNLLGVHEDGVWIRDSRSRRVLQFDPGGGLVGTYSLRSSSGLIEGVTSTLDRLVVRTSNAERNPDQSQTYWSTMKVVSLEGDSLAAVDSGKVHTPPPVRVEGMGLIGFPAPFSASANITYHRGRGLLSTDGARPQMSWYDLDGVPTLRISLEIADRPVTDADREEYLAGLRSQLGEGGRPGSEAMVKAQIETAVFPDRMPFYQRVLVDDSGYLWVLPAMNMMDRDVNRRHTVRLLSPDGEYLGDVEIPVFTVSLSRGTLCSLGMIEETGEVEYIAYRIESAVPGFVYP